MPLHIFGDASEPGPRQAYAPTLAAVLRLPDGSLRTLRTEVRKDFIALLPRRSHLIYFYELLWPVFAAFAWRDDLAKAYPIIYEDNTGAQFNLLSGFSNCFASSLILAAFWGASAAQKSRPWIDRVASGDNPADCLTKPGLPALHLVGAQRFDERLFDPLWEFLIAQLRKKSFPSWASFEPLFAPRFQ